MGEKRRVWTPYSATRRLYELMALASHGATPGIMREISELGLLLHAPVAGTA